MQPMWEVTTYTLRATVNLYPHPFPYWENVTSTLAQSLYTCQRDALEVRSHHVTQSNRRRAALSEGITWAESEGAEGREPEDEE